MSLNIQRTIDKYLGYFIITILIIFKPLKKLLKLKNNKKIAVIRLWALGDTIMTFPMIKKLKEKGYEVDVICTNKNKWVFEKTEFIQNIMNLSPKLITKLFYYDYIIDSEPYFNMSTILSFFLGKKTIGFSNLYRGNLYEYKFKYNDKTHNVLNYTNLLKALNIDYTPDKLIPLTYSEQEKDNIDKKLKKYDKNKLIGLHTGSAETSTYRAWKIHNFEKLIKKILDKNKKIIIILTGSNNELESNVKLTKKINSDRLLDLTGTKLGELSYLMTKLDVFIDNDTGPMHVSAAMGCKTIGLFGPNLPERFKPFGKGNIAIYKARKLNCSPCVNPHLGKFRKCPYKGKCMDLISVNDVYNEVGKIIQ